jgi:hypothetical protein
MNACCNMPLFVFALSLGSFTGATASQPLAEVSAAIATPGLTIATVLHAEGAQVYECRAAADGDLAWRAREPTATLIFDGSTVGRHYAGPRWEYVDGSAIQAKSASSAPGATEDDIPWLLLDVVDQRGNGRLSGVTHVQRVNTRGGVARRSGSLPQCALLSGLYILAVIYVGDSSREIVLRQRGTGSNRVAKCQPVAQRQLGERS